MCGEQSRAIDEQSLLNGRRGGRHVGEHLAKRHVFYDRTNRRVRFDYRAFDYRAFDYRAFDYRAFDYRAFVYRAFVGTRR